MIGSSHIRRLRFLIPIVLVAFATVAALLLWWAVQQPLSQRVRQHHAEILGIIMGRLEHGLTESLALEQDYAGFRLIDQAAQSPNVRVLLLVDDQHHIKFAPTSTWHERTANQMTGYLPALARKSVGQQQPVTVVSADGTVIHGYYPIKLERSAIILMPDRWGTLYVEYDLAQPLLAAQRLAASEVLKNWGMTTALAIVLAVVLHLRVSRRVEQLVQSSHALANGNLEARSGMKGGDELADLGRAFDSMATQLKADFTELRLARDQLQISAKVIENSADAILISDRDNRIISVNKAFTEVTGYTPEEVLGKNPRILSSGQHNAAFYQAMWQSLNERGSWQGEIYDRRKDGEVYPSWLSLSAVKDEKGEATYYVSIFSDITEHKAAQQHIEFLAHHDALTKLPNRFLMQDRLHQAIAHAGRKGTHVGLMFLDLDRFKQVNDTLGHHAGDLLLQEVVARMKGCVRDTDTISRQGGDEFVIIVEDLQDANGVAQVARKLLDTLAHPLEIEGHAISTSFSIGISLYPDDGTEIGTLMQKADTAMYHSKESGRNTYHFFDEAMTADAMERVRLQNRLRKAATEGEFTLHFQPKLEIGSRRVIGCEALIRWQTEDGWVSPAKFIPVAEETGIILAIDDWVLTEACRQAQSWVEAGLPAVAMSVNISALQFKHGKIVETVAVALQRTGFDPRQLEIELTESVLIDDADHIHDILHGLKQLGITLAIDDYGTGYSNLSYLRRFQVDKLKIDQSFIKQAHVSENDAIIVHSTIELAHNLGLKVVAEGVENEEILSLLQRLGCDEAQGYHLGRPLPAEEFERFLRASL